MDYKNHVNSMFTFLHSIQSRRCLKIIIVTLLVFVLVSILCAYFVFRPGKPHPLSEQSYFTVVLDCGSTGTRVNVYEWLSNSTNNQDQPILLHSFPDHSTKNSLQKDACLYHCMQTEPGLDKFVQNSSGLRAALDPLLLWAKQQIPSQRHKDSFVFVLATAGLRRLPSEDAAWILANAEAILKEYPFAHSKSWVRVLSGQEEAYYVWIALNYKKGTLRGSSRVPTLGVLDMGGSSLQVVMETDESREDQNLVQLKIGPVEHQILAFSLPKFGLNEAFDRTVVMLSEKQSLSESTDGTFQLKHPCLSAGYLLNHTCYGCVQQNVSSWQNLSGRLLSNQSSTFYLIGDPDWEQCKGLAKAAATQSSNTDGLHLSMNMTDISSDGTNSLNITSSLGRGASFHALSGFFAVYSLLGLNPIANLTEFLERGQQICSGSWVNSNIFSGNRKYAEQFCFRVPYLASVIEDYLCMGNAKINFGPGDVSWTLGAALVEGEHTWLSKTEAPAVSFDLKNIEVLSYPTALFFLFLCLLLIIFWGHVKWTAISLVSALGIKGSSIGASLPSYIFPKSGLMNCFLDPPDCSVEMEDKCDRRMNSFDARNDQADLQTKANPSGLCQVHYMLSYHVGRIQCSLGEETKYGACFCMRSFGACGTERNSCSFKGIRSGVTQVILSFDCTVPL